MATDDLEWVAAPLVLVRAVIGRAFTPPPAGGRLGCIALHEHQRHAASRLRETIARSGGALLADPTGAGKTFTALAAAVEARALLVVAPAVLRERWRAALEQAARTGEVVSMESLAHDRLRSADHDWVIVDEAHHFRNPRTARYRTLARICRRARVVLVTATPVHNRLNDARAQVALFLGDAAFAMSPDDLGAFVVREGPPPSLPLLDGPHLVHPDVGDEAVLDRVLALPPPLRAVDVGDAGALATHTLVRRWASSRAALVATLRRRLATGEALLAAAHAGRAPTRRELAAWAFDGEAVQLAFAELLVDTPVDGAGLGTLADIERHLCAIRELLREMNGSSDPDEARAAVIRRIRQRHPGERIVAFTCHADSAVALARLLRPEGGVALLTGDRVEGASGRFSRGEMLAQLDDPQRPTPAHARIDLLVATDVLSEGVDMFAVSVVVHLDLPWNPAVLDQRVGRARRLGSPHERVSVYALAPPARAERMLDLENRLKTKIGLAALIVGAGPQALSPDASTANHGEMGAAVVESRIAQRLREWASATAPSRADHDASEHTIVASTAGAAGDWLALVHDGRRHRLVARIADGHPTEHRPAILCTLDALGRAMSAPVDKPRADAAVDAARDHLSAITVRANIYPNTPRSRTRDRILRHAASVVATARPSERARLASIAAAARAATHARWSAGDSAAFDALAHELPHEPHAAARWLQAVAQSAAPEAELDRQRPRLLALILFGSQDATRPTHQ